MFSKDNIKFHDVEKCEQDEKQENKVKEQYARDIDLAKSIRNGFSARTRKRPPESKLSRSQGKEHFLSSDRKTE